MDSEQSTTTKTTRSYASVLGPHLGTARYQQFKDLERTFPTEEEALAFGFSVARDWIDKKP